MFKQYWYVFVIGIVLVLWIIVDPAQEQQTSSDDMFVVEDTDTEEVSSEEDTGSTEVMVDIKGEVKQPGVFEMNAEQRVKDVVDLAGGFTEEADQTSINLAERVYDEMVIIVYSSEAEQGTNGSIRQADKIRINQASIEELKELPGVGEVKANAIIEYRESNGPFKDASELTKVTGIGDKTVEQLKEQVQVP
ncbi:ComEA family DNA-binding protein [Gracilibacillus halophilus]|nr:ComEA family DNA-binding protein [Gracilibacillus halophilus]